jgi:outer membrane protein OmpA-like peptidoglycan-associated protein
MPINPKDDKNLISNEKHELDYLLNKWEKSASKRNREILAGQLKKFKADKDWAPHNRKSFYEYVKEEDILKLLADKQTKASPVTLIHDSAEQDSSYTVIKKRAAIPRKKKKSVLVPILLMLLGLCAALVLVFFLFFYLPGTSTRITTRTPDSSETERTVQGEEQAPASGTEETEDTGAASLSQFKRILADNTPLLFVGDQAVLLPGQEAKLEAIAGGMADFKKIDFTLTGHTADTGLPSREMELSKERAVTVKNYLERVSTGTELLITTTGKGAAEPVVKNVPVSEQQPNRRVEIAVNSAE